MTYSISLLTTGARHSARGVQGDVNEQVSRARSSQFAYTNGHAAAAAAAPCSARCRVLRTRSPPDEDANRTTTFAVP